MIANFFINNVVVVAYSIQLFDAFSLSNKKTFCLQQFLTNVVLFVSLFGCIYNVLFFLNVLIVFHYGVSFKQFKL